MQKKFAEMLANRIHRINYDHQNYVDYSTEEFNIRESEINAIAYEIAELFAFDDNFDRELFMKMAKVI